MFFKYKFFINKFVIIDDKKTLILNIINIKKFKNFLLY